MPRPVLDLLDQDDGDTWVVNIPEANGSGADHSLPQSLRLSELAAKQAFCNAEGVAFMEDRKAFDAIDDARYADWVDSTYRKLSEIGQRVGTGSPLHRDRIMNEFISIYSNSDEFVVTMKRLFQVDAVSRGHRYVAMSACLRIRDHYFLSLGLDHKEPDQAAIRYRLSKTVAECIQGETQKIKEVKGNAKRKVPKRRKRLEMLNRHIRNSMNTVKALSKYPQSFATLERQQENFGRPLAVVDDDIFEVFLLNDKRIYQILSGNCLNVSDHAPFVELVNEITGDLNMTDLRLRLPGIDIGIIDKLFRRYVKLLIQDLGGDVVRRRTVEDCQGASDDLSFPAFLVALNRRLDVVSALLGDGSDPPSPDRDRHSRSPSASPPSGSSSTNDGQEEARAVRDNSPKPSTSKEGQSDYISPSNKRKWEDVSMKPSTSQDGQLNDTCVSPPIKRSRVDAAKIPQTKSPQPSTSKGNNSSCSLHHVKSSEDSDIGLSSPAPSANVEGSFNSTTTSVQEDTNDSPMMTQPGNSTAKETADEHPA